MTDRRFCTRCQAELPEGSPGDRCPRCLLGLALEDGLEEPGAGSENPEGGRPEEPGQRIGRYKLLQQIGEGGCGVVYMAEQLEPVRRRVALKIIKLGMDTKSVIARFEAERQALALMEHPNIAQVLDAGATENGRPYFVMELVRGIKITEYCDENQLPTSERLKLFIQVCQAVQHAHQKGIIHRDLKPSNILVTVNNGVPIPKVIDFGVVKAINQQQLTDKTLFTAFEQFIGTPAYMSPEQAVMTSLDVDTRSDIYSLGVLLYELLTRQTPFNSKELLKSGLDEMRRTIREKEPVKPSTRLNQELVGAQTRKLKAPALEKPPSEEEVRASSRRVLQTKELIQRLRGDLDWIVMKCLEKDRTRRYETANGLARDIQRHLDHEPVLARPPSALYRLQKMAQRNRVAFAAAAMVLGALIAGLSVSTLLLISEMKARERAQAAEREQGRLREQAQAAERNGLEKLREAYVAQARANRRSSLAGRRIDSLKVLQQAAAIPVGPGQARAAGLTLRNETIACLALPDLRLLDPVRAANSPEQRFNFDAGIERYALVDEAGVVHIRRLASDEELFQLPAATNGVTRVHGFSPNGQFLAVVFHERHLRVWNLERRQLSLSLDGQANIAEVVFAPDSRTAAVLSMPGDGPIPIYEIGSGKLARTLRASGGAAKISFSADGAYLATVPSMSHTVEIIQVESGDVTARLPHSRPVEVVAWHPQNRLLAVGTRDMHLHLWNPMTGQACASLAGHRSFVVGAAFHPNGELLASTAWDGTTRLWDVATSEQLIELGKANADMKFSPDGRRLGMLPWDAGQMVIVDVAHTRVCRPLAETSPGLEAGHSGGYYSAAFSPDERLLVSTSEEGVCLWDLTSGRPTFLPGLSDAISAQFHPDARQLLVTSRAGRFRWTLESVPTTAASTMVVTKQPADFGRIGRVAVSRSGALVAYVQEDHVNLERSGNPPVRLTPVNRPDRIAISPDEQWLAAAPWPNGATVIWDTGTGEMLREITTPTPEGIAFSPDSRWLVIAAGGEYSFFEVKSGEPGRRIPVDKAGALAFSHDARLLAVSVRKALVKLLDTATMEEVATLEAPSTAMIEWLAFSPSDTQLAVTGAGHPIQVWDLRALRRELAARQLDWNHPAYAPGPPHRESVKLLVRPVIPPRPAGAGLHLLDLTDHYTTELTETWGPQNNLAELPPGVHRLGGVEYDVRGSINLGNPRARSYPHGVAGLPVGQQCRRLHFLGGTGFTCPNGTQVAIYRVHYADGQSIDIPVIAGRDHGNWWYRPEDQGAGLDVVWTGINPAAASAGYRIRLCHSSWENPRPDVMIASLDLVSSMTDCVHFVVAITAE